MEQSIKAIKPQKIIIYAIATIITLACVNMALFMEPGLASSNLTIAERMQFVAENKTLWQLSWATWMVAALGLLTFCYLLYSHLPKHPAKLFGLLCVAIGIAPDLCAEAIFAFVLPNNQSLNMTTDTYAQFETIAMLFTGGIGNGMYNIGGLILNIILLQSQTFPRWVALAGIPAWLFGIGLTIATFLLAIDAAKIFTAIAMVWSTAWMVLFAHYAYPEKRDT